VRALDQVGLCRLRHRAADFLNDREFNAQRRRIERFSKVWAQRLGINWFRVAMYFERDGLPMHDHESGWPCLASTNGAWEYMDFTIHWNMPEAAHTDDEELEECVIHEFFHVLVKEMQSDQDVAHEERVVTLLTKAARWTYAAGLREGKKQA
jgi:hypothetical protein